MLPKSLIGGVEIQGFRKKSIRIVGGKLGRERRKRIT